MIGAGGKVLKTAAAAAAMIGTGRRHALRRSVLHRNESAARSLHDGFNRLAGQGKGNPDGTIRPLRNTLAAAVERGDVKRKPHRS